MNSLTLRFVAFPSCRHFRLAALLVLLAVASIAAVSTMLDVVAPERALAQPIARPYPFVIPTRDASDAPLLPNAPLEQAGVHGAVHIGPDGHIVAADGTRLRFFGTSLHYSGQFVADTDARQLAHRLHKLGFNAVRLLYNDYFGADDASFFKYYDSVGKINTSSYVLNPAQLARFDTLLYELKQQGIYAFLVLNSNHRMTPGDGIVRGDSIYSNSYLLQFLDPIAAALEAKWARTLLTHRNPITGLRYADDPQIVMVDLNEENSLYYYWTLDRLNYIDEANKLTRGKSTISYYHSRHLDTLYNLYLRNKYGNEAALVAAWAGAQNVSTAELMDNGSFENFARLPATWNFTTRNSASAQPLFADGAIDSSVYVKVKILSDGSTPNAGNINYTNTTVRLGKDSLYEFDLWCKLGYDATRPKVTTRNVTLTVTDFATGVRSLTVVQQIDTTWKKYTFAFRAQASGLQNITISMGAELGDVWLDALSIKHRGETALAPGEQLNSYSVGRLLYKSLALVPFQRIRDQVQFLDSLERAFYEPMTRLIKDSIGFKGLVNYTQTNTWALLPDIYTATSGDVASYHSGWDFFSARPGKGYSDSTWMVRGYSMVRSRSGGTVPGMVANSVAGKPFYVGEYTVPWANQNHTEHMAILPVYASAQDWDGIFFTPYAQYRNDLFANQFLNAFHQPTSQYALANNSAMLALAPIMSRIFRDGLVLQPPMMNTLPDTLVHDPDDVWLTPNYSRGMFGVEGNLDANIFTQVTLRQHFNDTRHKVAQEYPYTTYSGDTTPRYSLDTMTVWDEVHGRFMAAGPNYLVATGFFGQDTVLLPARAAFPFHIALSRKDRVNEILSVAMVSEDSLILDRSKSLLLTISTRAQNSGLTWVDSNGFGSNWGSGPVLLSAATTMLSWRTPYDSVFVYPLDSTGRETGARIPVLVEDSIATLTLDQSSLQTPWFHIVQAQGPSHESVGEAERSATIAVMPNPAVQTVSVIGCESHANVTLVDDLGRVVMELSDYTSATPIDVGSVPAGHYLLVVRGARERQVRHLEVVH